MEQESNIKNIAIIGCGAAGGLAALLLCKNPYCRVTAFDKREPFSTLLPTGGGRCNITFDESDVREFVKNYPRGEKFLLSVFSKFGVEKTRALFKDLGIKTYVQEDRRVFPVSNSSLKTIQQLSKHLDNPNFVHEKEEVISIFRNDDFFLVKTSKKEYKFDYVLVSTGGRGQGAQLAKSLGHNIIEQRPSLCSFDVVEKDFYSLAGVSFRNVQASFKTKKKYIVEGDLLFAHKFITAPLVFKISALTAYEEISKERPLEISFKLIEETEEEIESFLRKNSKKTVKNIFSNYVPERFISLILKLNKIDGNKQGAQLKNEEKKLLIDSLLNFKLHVVKRIKDSEIVTAGGVDLKEVDSKTMQSKIVNGLFFAGEVLNIDAYTGGFNLQNCWSTAYIVSSNI